MVSKAQLEKLLATEERILKAQKSLSIDATESITRTEDLIAKIKAEINKR